MSVSASTQSHRTHGDWIRVTAFFAVLWVGIVSIPANAEPTGASAANRKSRLINVDFTLWGAMGHYGTSGLSLGFNLGSYAILEGGYYAGTAENDYWRLDGKTMLGRLKLFLGNSFFLSIGGFQRTATPEARLVTVLGTVVSETANNLPEPTTFNGAEFAIGNQWQHSWFTIGCDWIGFWSASEQQAESSTAKSGYDADGFHSSESTTYREGYDEVARSSSGVTLLRTYVGISF